jgi:hypothetical protein
MKRILTLVLLIAVASGLQQCGYSQSKPATKKVTMDTKKETNPVYSRTDTSKVALSEEEWKKMLPEDVYLIARQKGTERPGPASLKNLMKLERIIARPVVIHCSGVMPNTKVVADGPVFMSLSAKPASSIRRIIPME